MINNWKWEKFGDQRTLSTQERKGWWPKLVRAPNALLQKPSTFTRVLPLPASALPQPFIVLLSRQSSAPAPTSSFFCTYAPSPSPPHRTRGTDEGLFRHFGWFAPHSSVMQVIYPLRKFPIVLFFPAGREGSHIPRCQLHVSENFGEGDPLWNCVGRCLCQRLSG